MRLLSFPGVDMARDCNDRREGLLGVHLEDFLAGFWVEAYSKVSDEWNARKKIDVYSGRPCT